MKSFNASTSLSTVTLVLMALVMTACGKQPKTFNPGTTDTFTYDNSDRYSAANRLLQADYLFAMDVSYSNFGGNAANIKSSINQFMSALRSENIDYNIGFINANVHSTYSLSTKIAKMPVGFLGGILTLGMNAGAQESILNQIAQPLSENEAWHLEASSSIMSAQSSSLLRPAAQLVYVFISDSDDKSNLMGGDRSPTAYANRLKTYKSHPDYISSRAIIFSASKNNCAPRTDIGQSNATRIEQAAKLIDHDDDSKVVSCIKNDFSTNLTNMARDVTRPADRFTLQAPVVPGSVKVFVQGVAKAEDSFSYNEGTNEVLFDKGFIPAPGESVEFRYDPIMSLSRVPVVASISVRVNGREVPANESNGFVYQSEGNRIVLRGPAAQTNSEVSVSYQVE